MLSSSSTLVAACTIIARNYLAQARVLIDSYLKYAPGAPFYLFIVDGPPPGLELQPTVSVLGPEDVPMPGFREMSFKYDITELCTAVKPSLLQFLLTERQEQSIVYFDPDIVIFRELSELWECLASSNIVLIPHLLDPIPLDGLLPDEQGILAAGAYNLGFIALKASDDTARLLQWWEERLQDSCRIDLANGLFVDQKWMDLAPSLFSGTAILRDATYDVAYWNLHSRPLERDASQVVVNGRPLAFFHFSGYNPSSPRVLSKHQNRLTVVDGTALAYLLDMYAGLVYRRGFLLAQQWPYGYRCFDNGVLISPLQRHLYQSLDAATRAQFGDPFEVDGAGSFFSWSVRPSAAFGDISPFLDRLLVERPDVRDAIPEPRGRDSEQFARWAITDGAAQMAFDPLLADLDFWREADGRASLIKPPDTEHAAPVGVNVCGYLRNETGLGAVTRGFISALRGSGVPLGMRDLRELSPNRSEDSTLERIDERAPYDINLVCVNADQHFVAKSHLGADFFNDRYNIGVWFWELPSFPREWWDRFDEYDEVWATSSFIADTLAAVSPIPIVRIPPVLVSPLAASREAGRAKLGVDPDEFVYLFTFDFSSYFERKNPLAVIEAFRQAYRPGDQARLVIKCVNEDFDQAAFERMTALAAELPVSIRTGYWNVAEMRDLTAACDAYVSLHHSEGLGLTIAEAMALGKPVIATAWSGNADFMTPANSFPVSFQLVKLDQDVGPYRAGSQWAEPSIAEASQFMRLVYDDRGLARARGESARRDIERDYSVERVGEVIQERLAVIVARRRKRIAASSGLDRRTDLTQVDGLLVEAPAVGTSGADEAIDVGRPIEVVQNGPVHGAAPSVPSMELGESSHGPLGVLAKRSMDFLLRYHTHYQSEVNLTFSRFMRELDARQTEHDRDLRELFRRSDLTDPVALRGLYARVEHLSASARLVAGMSARIEELSARVDHLSVKLKQVVGISHHVDELNTRVEQLEPHASLAGLSARIDDLGLHIERIDGTTEVRELQTRIGQLQEAVGSLDTFAQAVRDWESTAEEHLGELTTGITAGQDAGATLSTAIEGVSEAVSRIEAAFSARPYMAEDIFGARGNLDDPMGFSIDAQNPAWALGSPPAFEDLFRGSESFIAERQRVYLPFFEGLRNVVDLGSGRGELLDLLSEKGIDAVGVELDEALVTRCRERGRHMELADAFEYLQGQPDGSLDAIFSAQVVEHFDPARLPEFLLLAHAKLRTKGLLIAETVNPESYTALKTFHVDLTHNRPIYPQVLLHLCQQAGFLSGRIFYPLGGGFTQTSYAQAGEYALIALR